MKLQENIEEQHIKNIMASAWGIDPKAITSEARFSEFPQWDSMGHVNLLVSLEQRYHIAIDYGTLSELISIPAIIKYLQGNNHD